MDDGRGHCTPSPASGLASPHSLQTPPNLEPGVIVTESDGLSPKHGQQTSGLLASPRSALETPPRRSPVSPAGLAPVQVPQHKGYPPAGMNGGVPKHCLDAFHPRGGGGGGPAVGTPVSAPAALAYGGRPTHPPSPPGVPADVSVNECRLIDYRGAKVAAFLVNAEYLLCLPQAFELFLKHLVGGLHTVYTKLKRLDITPIVCNVEQVRILRGLGAIQPGVNRCKLLSCKDFDTLYKDCTTASSRPGRPPKRASMIGMHVSTGGHATLLKKTRLDGDYSAYENGHVAGERIDKSHGLLANGYSHHSSTAAGAPPHISPIPFMALNHPSSHPNSMVPVSLPLSATSHGHGHQLTGGRTDSSMNKERSTHDVIVSSRVRDDRVDNLDAKERLYNLECHRVKDQYVNGTSVNCHSPVLNLSQNSSRRGGGEHSGSETAYNDCQEDDYNDSEDDEEDDREQDFSDNPDVTSTGNSERLTNQALFYPHVQVDGMTATGQVVSSIETLLRNIQGLLKVAADNARQQDRQISVEKAELKMEVMRERELRENLEKQLLEEQRIRTYFTDDVTEHCKTQKSSFFASFFHLMVRDDRVDNLDAKERLYNLECHRVKDQYVNGTSVNCHSPVLNLSQNSSRRGGGEHSGSETAYNDCQEDDYNDSEDDEEDDREQDFSDNPDVTSTGNSERLTNQALFYPHVQVDGMTATGQVVSSIETLLRNIQGLLKVAADNARQQDRQISVEKAELKMEVMRERELRENLEKQLLEEQRIRILYQKRLKKEKKSRRRIQEQLESEMKKRVQYEEALRNSSAETIRLLNDSLAQELERAERNVRNDAEHKVQDCPMSV
ncbi:dachshund homolog 1-like [Centruroides sculpturatus]|uniref:dachshund homolog 1-like n=1 Tax=Centruroides sculpturatus TaxID=218467 RepID=UPI000C6E611D|nr:dachshund homolog 1-like [Centruroides sculpturatus]